MGTPAQLATGIERLAAYAREAGRNAAELDIVYRTHDYALHSDGQAAAGHHTTATRLSALRPRSPWTSGSTRPWG